MEEVFLSLGGNIGDVAATLGKAKKMLSELPSLHNLRFSPLFRTSPVSDIPQEDYHNCAATFFTDTDPTELLHTLEKIEKELGKISKPKNYPRSIDIDIILYGRCRVAADNLFIPHPQFHRRLFVLIPLSYLTNHIYVPTENGVTLFDLDKEITKLQNSCPDSVEVAYEYA